MKSYDAPMKNNMLNRTCRLCECTFVGGPRAWYCPTCRDKRQKIADARYKANKRSGNVIPLGSTIHCEICGTDIIKNSGLQRFCNDCAYTHLKEVDNKQSLAWKRSNPEKVKELQRIASRKNIETGEAKQSGIKGVNWDKSSKRWKVVYYENKKQHYIGKFKDKDTAISALDKYLKTKRNNFMGCH